MTKQEFANAWTAEGYRPPIRPDNIAPLYWDALAAAYVGRRLDPIVFGDHRHRSFVRWYAANKHIVERLYRRIAFRAKRNTLLRELADAEARAAEIREQLAAWGVSVTSQPR